MTEAQHRPLPPELGRFPFRVPPEMDGSNVVHPVVIVGAGPVGLTAALTLSQAGVACVLLEDDDQVCSGSRALGMSRRTLEIWEAVGAASSILAHGKPWRSGRSFYRGQTILDFTMADDPSVRHRPMFNIQQCYTEHYLVEALAASGHADVRWHSRVERLEQQRDLVELQVSTPQGSYALQARYVVACDGARSTVRSALGLYLHGASYDASYVIADIELETDGAMERRCWFDPPSNPGLTVLMHGQPDRLWRLDYQLGEDEDAAVAAQPQNVMQRVQHHLDYIGETGTWRLEWSSPYRVHSRALDAFVHDRVAFAGDAAHLMPIFGIRGLNSGVEDAWNLGRKLVQVLQGRSAPTVLQAYSQERRAVFVENAALAHRNAVFMTPQGQGGRLVRDAVLSLALGGAPVQDILNPKQATYVPLRNSPLSTPDEQAWECGPAPGEVVPNLACGGGAHLQGTLSTGHTVLYFTANASEEEARRVASAMSEQHGLHVVPITTTPLGLPHALLDAPGALHAHFGAVDGAVYLVRDDHHIAARWKRFDASRLHGALERLRGGSGSAAAQAPVPEPALSPAECIYRTLGDALNALPQEVQPMFLAKLALSLGLQRMEPGAFEAAVRAAQADLP